MEYTENKEEKFFIWDYIEIHNFLLHHTYIP